MVHVDLVFNHDGEWISKSYVLYSKKHVHLWRGYDSDLLSFNDLVDEFNEKLGFVGVQQLIIADPSAVASACSDGSSSESEEESDDEIYPDDLDCDSEQIVDQAHAMNSSDMMTLAGRPGVKRIREKMKLLRGKVCGVSPEKAGS
ncbi:hypothetical protein RND71_038523 [Anisodus tanguticus]|uniref:Uncharacterized protein n=1 Tax=Anisodus tanguticus TaxID=243964 RepID=A0AAE1R2U0_9SOLA|nr:hypothetical protein RND71_038523 [Anisodus tanguticus]